MGLCWGLKINAFLVLIGMILMGSTEAGEIPTDLVAGGNPSAKRLYEDLLSDYNRLIRPVANITQKLTVRLKLKLSQLIEVNLRNQVMRTNVWVEQKWYDYKLRWDPAEYGGVEMLYVPSEHIWLPDIVLFNNADGNYEVTLMTKATLRYDGEVLWTPPAVYQSSCEMNVEWFPFDEQSCAMRFGSWTYDGFQVDLKHMDQANGTNMVDIGIDLREFYLSVEWDILEVPAKRNEEYYPEPPRPGATPGAQDVSRPYPDITFHITLRRKTLFYTVNLIIPCVGISFLTVLVFYLPADSGEKVSLCISVLVSLTVFILLLAEIIPPTSLAVPLLGKYLLFTMILVMVSVYVTVYILNIHFRRPCTHQMPDWVRKLFIQIMPRFLLIKRPEVGPKKKVDDELKYLNYGYNEFESTNQHQIDPFGRPIRSPFGDGPSSADVVSGSPQMHSTVRDELYAPHTSAGNEYASTSIRHQRNYAPDVLRAIEGVQFIAQHIKDDDEDNDVQEDWKYIAMVLDRFFLWIFTLACVLGTCGIIFQAPSLYDRRKPIDVILSEIGRFY
ncbi:unnamed protein product [Notodromas monacha]|uniref:Uncharacterized protein n=1 Tax=Notodromas monacha TaxID=399045 RepID=A0A7R9BMU5_9CRUS|nr:unnamed protein product [Notodromas monacha]CAG0918419.1 unnamed protein product [Notodromas monacha]